MKTKIEKPQNLFYETDIDTRLPSFAAGSGTGTNRKQLLGQTQNFHGAERPDAKTNYTNGYRPAVCTIAAFEQ
jgi:hypothetical protein